MPEYVLKVKVVPDKSGADASAASLDKVRDSARGANSAVAGLDPEFAKFKKHADSTRALNTAAASAGSAFVTFTRQVETGGKGAERSLAALNVKTEELRQLIRRAQEAGAPVSPTAATTLRNLEQETDRYTQKLGQMRVAQERAKDATQDATRASGGFGGGIRSVSDLLGELDDDLEVAAIRLGLFLGAATLALGIMRDMVDQGGKLAISLGADQEAVDKLTRKMGDYLTMSGLLRAAIEGQIKDLQVVIGMIREYGNGFAFLAAVIRDPIAVVQKFGEEWRKAFMPANQQFDAKAFGLDARKRALEELMAANQRRWEQEAAASGKAYTLEDRRRQLEELMAANRRKWNTEAETASKREQAALERYNKLLDEANFRVRATWAQIAKDNPIPMRAVDLGALDKVIAKEQEIARAEKKAADDYRAMWQRNYQEQEAALERIAKQYEGLAVAGGLGGTPYEVFKQQQSEIKALVAEGVRDAEWGAAALKGLTTSYWNDQLNVWSDALHQLASEFGGFFAYLAQAVDALQRSRQLGSSVESAASGMKGVSSEAAAAAGGIATVAAIFYEVYKAVSAHLKSERAQRYGSAAEYTLVGGEEGLTNLSRQSFAVTNAIRDVVREFGDALGGTVTDLAKIGIRIRNDGKYVAAYVNGLMLGHFDNINDAIRAALVEAVRTGQVQIAGISDLVREGLANFTGSDYDGLIDMVSALREISDLGLPEGARDMQDLARHTNELFQVLMNMPMSSAVIDGIGNLLGNLTGGLQQLFDTLTGHKDDPRQEAERKAASYNAQRAIVIAQLTLMRLELEARIAEYNVRMQLLRLLVQNPTVGGGGAGDGGPGFGGPRGGNPSKGGGVLFVDSRNPGNDPQLAMMLQALDSILRAIQGLPPALTAEDIKLPRHGGGRGGQRQSDQDQLRDILRQDELAGMTDLARGMAEIEDRRKEEIRLAHGNASMIRQVNIERDKEIARLKETKLASIQDRAKALGGSGFLPTAEIDEVRASAAALRTELAELAATGVDVTAQLALVAAAEQYRLTQIGFGLIDRLYGYLKDDADWQAQSVAHAKLKVDLEFKIIEAQLRALNMWDEATQKLFNAAHDAALKLAEGGGGPGPSGGDMYWDGNRRAWVSGQSSQANSDWIQAQKEHIRQLAEVNKSLRDFKKSLALDELSPLTPRQRLQEAESAYRATVAAALGGNLDAQRAFPQAFQDFMRELRSFGGTDARYLAFWNEGQAFLDQLIQQTGGTPAATATPLTPGNYPGPTAGQQALQHVDQIRAIDRVEGATNEVLDEAYQTRLNSAVQVELLTEIRNSIGGTYTSTERPLAGQRFGSAA